MRIRFCTRTERQTAGFNEVLKPTVIDNLSERSRDRGLAQRDIRESRDIYNDCIFFFLLILKFFFFLIGARYFFHTRLKRMAFNPEPR